MYVCMNVWMHDACMDESMDASMDAQIYECMNVWMYGYGCMYGSSMYFTKSISIVCPSCSSRTNTSARAK